MYPYPLDQNPYALTHMIKHFFCHQLRIRSPDLSWSIFLYMDLTVLTSSRPNSIHRILNISLNRLIAFQTAVMRQQKNRIITMHCHVTIVTSVHIGFLANYHNHLSLVIRCAAPNQLQEVTVITNIFILLYYNKTRKEHLPFNTVSFHK